MIQLQLYRVNVLALNQNISYLDRTMSTIYSNQLNISCTGWTRNQADICREFGWIVMITFSQMFHSLSHTWIDCISVQYSNMCCRQQADSTARLFTRCLYYSSCFSNTAVWECNTDICIGSVGDTLFTAFSWVPLEVCTSAAIISCILFE